ncbi:Fimbrial Usher protein [compost metagenome]
MVAASIVLVDGNNKELALGSQVRHEQSGALAVVGWDGLVYLEGLAADNSLQVQIANGGSCRVHFKLAPEQDQVPLIGPLVCQ